VNFEKARSFGGAAEDAVAVWLKNRGWAVLPAYEKIIPDHKGPRVSFPNEDLVAPDFLVFNGRKTMWVEVKRKSAFTFYRKTQRWTTGIDLRLYKDYCRVEEIGPWPVWILFIHDGGQAKDSPRDNAPGLFGKSLRALRGCIDHIAENQGSSGMVHWAKESLLLLDSWPPAPPVPGRTSHLSLGIGPPPPACIKPCQPLAFWTTSRRPPLKPPHSRKTKPLPGGGVPA
jgi:hypothetical protein